MRQEDPVISQKALNGEGTKYKHELYAAPSVIPLMDNNPATTCGRRQDHHCHRAMALHLVVLHWSMSPASPAPKPRRNPSILLNSKGVKAQCSYSYSWSS